MTPQGPTPDASGDPTDLLDRCAIADLVARYAAGADGRDARAVGELFTGDATLVMPDPPRRLEPCLTISGRAGIIEAMRRLQAVPVTLHAILGHVIDIAADRADARGIVTGAAHHLTDTDTGTVDRIWYLHYRDDYVRAGAGWRFLRRQLRIDWMETREVRRRAPTALPWTPAARQN